MTGPKFPAKWNSDCERCGGNIEEGEIIGYLDDDLSCARCIEDAYLDEEWYRREDEGMS